MVDLSERFANVGYHDENWQARTCSRVSCGKIGVVVVAIALSLVIAATELAPNSNPCTALGLEPPLADTLVTFAGYGGFLFFRVSLDRRKRSASSHSNRLTDARVDVRRRARGRDRRTVTSIPKTPAGSHAPRRTQQLQVDP